MGQLSFLSGAFSFSVTLTYNASSAKVLQWKTALAFASQLLYDATDGQAWFGTISIGNNGTGVSHADLRLRQQYYPNPGDPRSGCTGCSGPHDHYVYLYDDETERPFVIIHEFSHYAFCLGDEYWWDNSVNRWRRCTGHSVTESACIMGYGWNRGLQIDAHGNVTNHGIVSEYCCQPNHSTFFRNPQHVRHGESCWATITDAFGEIEGPAAGERPAQPAPETGPPVIVWQEILAGSVVVTVDEGDAATPPAAMALRQSTELLRVLPDVKVFSEADLSDDTPKDAPDSPSSKEKRADNSDSQLTSGLRRVIRFFEDQPLSGRRSVLTIWDTAQISQSDASAIGAQFAGNRIDLHAATSPLKGSSGALHDLTHIGRGSWRPMSFGTTPEPEESRLVPFLSAVSCVEFFGIVDHQRVPLRRFYIEDTDQAAGKCEEDDDGSSALQAQLPVVVETEAETVVFAAAVPPGDGVRLDVIAPDGSCYEHGAKGDAQSVGASDAPLKAIVVTKPQPGRWLMRVIPPPDCDGSASVELMTAVRNRSLDVSLRTSFCEADVLEISAFASWDGPVRFSQPIFAEIERLDQKGIWTPFDVVRLIPENSLPNQVESGFESHRLTGQTRLDKSGQYRVSCYLTHPGTIQDASAALAISSDHGTDSPSAIPAFCRRVTRHVVKEP